MIEEIALTMVRMRCNGCVQNITKIVQALPGVQVVQTDLPTRTLLLRYDTQQADVYTIKQMLAEGRYPVSLEHSDDVQGHTFPQIESSAI